MKPGLYQIRVGVRDPQTEQMGTASAWVEVPDLKSKKLILSSISTNRFQLDSDDAKPGAVKAVPQPNVRNGVNIFRRGDFITYYGKAVDTKNPAIPIIIRLVRLYQNRIHKTNASITF